MDNITREQFAFYAIQAFSNFRNKSPTYIGNQIGYGGRLHNVLLKSSVKQEIVDKVIDYVGRDLSKSKEQLWQEAVEWHKQQQKQAAQGVSDDA